MARALVLDMCIEKYFLKRTNLLLTKITKIENPLSKFNVRRRKEIKSCPVHTCERVSLCKELFHNTKGWTDANKIYVPKTQGGIIILLFSMSLSRDPFNPIFLTPTAKCIYTTITGGQSFSSSSSYSGTHPSTL